MAVEESTELTGVLGRHDDDSLSKKRRGRRDMMEGGLIFRSRTRVRMDVPFYLYADRS